MTTTPATLADVMRQGHDLAIYCLDWRRMAVVKPLNLALCVGEDFPVPRLFERKRLKCSGCGSRNATIRLCDPHAPLTPGWQTRA